MQTRQKHSNQKKLSPESDNWKKTNIYIKEGWESMQWNIDEITHLPSLKMLAMYHSQSKYHIIT